ncbi:HpaA family protein [Helicobacter sp. 13S00477-4]|uniref:HpaA family protein n=1 Tax=Helicobacter sp. 13S00477-4 TaxID=1905759 RepID=UPI000BA5AFA8|nr:HpaA family protein [Helicobacter sp. 13S00477-4]PAF52176.1 hypothetical protein BKH44_03490 [Helicobacter sp. 13S00477-4]
MDTLNIDINRFNIKASFKVSSEGNAGTFLLPKGWAEPDMKDNSLDSMRKVLNELWVKILDKIDNKIVYQTLNGYEKDIKEIKSNKRF